MGSVFFPPTSFVMPTRPLIFLAGPIQGAPDWQAAAIARIRSQSLDVDIASPRWPVFVPLDEEGKQDQFDWEIAHLEHAAVHGAILFWGACPAEDVPGRSYAQTTRAEFGRYAALHGLFLARIVVGAEDEFHGRGYWERTLQRFCPSAGPLLRDLDAVCDAAVKVALRT